MASSVSTTITNALTDPLGMIWGNAGMVNSYNFMLRVEALYDLPCKSVRGFSKQNEYDPIQEGGLNDYVHMLRKPISQPFSFQVERYVGNEMFNPLSNGTELILPVILYISSHVRDDFTMPMRYYVFTGCHVSGVEYGELNAERSGLHTEVVTIQYKELIVVTNTLENISLLEPHDITKGKEKGTRGNYIMANTENTYAQTASDVGYSGVSGGDESSDTTSYHLRTKDDMEKMAKANKYVWKQGEADKLHGNTTNTSSIADQYKQIRNASGVTELTKDEMKTAAASGRYEWLNDDKTVNTTNSGIVANQNKTLREKSGVTELSKDDMAAAAAKNKYNWTDKDKKTVNTNNSTGVSEQNTTLRKTSGVTEKTKADMETAAAANKYNWLDDKKAISTKNSTGVSEQNKTVRTDSGVTEKSKKDMIAAAKGYHFKDGDVENNKNTDAYTENLKTVKYYEAGKSKAEMEKAAKRYDYANGEVENPTNTESVAAQNADVRKRAGAPEEKSKEEMKAAAIRYNYANGKEENTTNTSSVTAQEASIKTRSGASKEKSKAEMEKAAIRYNYANGQAENTTNTSSVAAQNADVRKKAGAPEEKSKKEMADAAKGYQFTDGTSENNENTAGYKENLKQVKHYEAGKSKGDMEKAASGYQFNKGSANWFNTEKYKANVASIKGYAEPLNGSRMAARAKKYPPHRSAVDVTKFLKGDGKQ